MKYRFSVQKEEKRKKRKKIEKKGKVQNRGTSIIIQKERSYQGDKREKAAPEYKQK